MIMRVRSVRSRLIILLLIVIIPAIVITGIAGIATTQIILEKEINQQSVTISRFLIETLQQHIDTAAREMNVLKVFIESTESRNFDIALIQSVLENSSSLLKIQIADKDGRITQMLPQDPAFTGIDISRTSYFINAGQSSGIYWSDVFISPQLNIPVVTCSLKLKDMSVLTGYLSLRSVSQTIERIPNDDFTEISVVDKNGVYLGHEKIEKVLSREYDTYFQTYRAKYQDTLLHQVKTINHQEFDVYIDFVNNGDWAVLLYQNKAQIRNIRRTSLIFIGLIAIVTLAITILSGLIHTKRTLKPLQELIHQTNRIAEGDYNYHLVISSYQEYEELAVTFRSMTASLKQRETELISQQQRLQDLFDSLPSLVIAVNDQMDIILQNKKTDDYNRISEGENDDPNLFKRFPALGQYQEKIRDTIKTGSENQMPKIPLVYGRKLHTCNLHLVPFRFGDSDGAIVRIEDITQTVQLEQMIIQTDKAASLGGLTAGIYQSINSPLAAVIQQVQVLKRRVDESLEANRSTAEKLGLDYQLLQQYFQKRRIPEMIENLLEETKKAIDTLQEVKKFSIQQPRTPILISINPLLKELQNLSLHEAIIPGSGTERQVSIQLELDEDIPRLYCRTQEFLQGCLKIIKNAIQAIRESGQKDGIIIIRSVKTPTAASIEIENNGPSIPDSDMPSLFDPFFTTRGEPFHGLGLTTAKHIIENGHKGRLSAFNLAEKRGVCFRIELPFPE